MLPNIESLAHIFPSNKIKYLKIAALIVLGFSFLFTINQFGKYKYQETELKECKLIIEKIGSNQIINICPTIYTKWFLHGYFARYANISLDTNNSPNRQFLLIDNSCQKSFITSGYDQIELPPKNYSLFKLKD